MSKSDGARPNDKRRQGTKTANGVRRSRLVSPTPSASDDNDDEKEEEDEDDNGENEMDRDQDAEKEASHASAEESPEPDFILAEVTREPNEKEHAIPLPLLHRIMAEHWTEKDMTRISSDARVLVGRYVEVFVKEAIGRSVVEQGGGGKAGKEADVNDGWVEVEDLERIAPQLCLDF